MYTVIHRACVSVMKRKECLLYYGVWFFWIHIYHFPVLEGSQRSCTRSSRVWCSDGLCECVLPVWKWVVRAGTKSCPFQLCFKFNIIYIFFQCKILLGFSICNFKANSTNIYHNFLSNPIVLTKWTFKIGYPKLLLTIQWRL